MKKKKWPFVYVAVITRVTMPKGSPIRENTDKNTIPRMISGIMMGSVDT